MMNDAVRRRTGTKFYFESKVASESPPAALKRSRGRLLIAQSIEPIADRGCRASGIRGAAGAVRPGGWGNSRAFLKEKTGRGRVPGDQDVVSRTLNMKRGRAHLLDGENAAPEAALENVVATGERPGIGL